MSRLRAPARRSSERRAGRASGRPARRGPVLPSPSSDGSRRTRANSSSESSSRSASSASIVMPMPWATAARASSMTAGHELGEHALALRELVARVQRRKLDRDRRLGVDRRGAAGGARADRGDRIARRHRDSAARRRRVSAASPSMSNEWRSFACAPSRLRASASPIVRPITNCSAITFIACRIATRTTGSPARATTRSYHAFGSRASSLSSRVRRPGQHQAPRRRVDQQRVGRAEMPLPVAARELVADQQVRRAGVGNAQQRLGDAHQQHAFLRRQVVLLQERFDAGVALALRARLRPTPRACAATIARCRAVDGCVLGERARPSCARRRETPSGSPRRPGRQEAKSSSPGQRRSPSISSVVSRRRWISSVILIIASLSVSSASTLSRQAANSRSASAGPGGGST